MFSEYQESVQLENQPRRKAVELIKCPIKRNYCFLIFFFFCFFSKCILFPILLVKENSPNLWPIMPDFTVKINNQAPLCTRNRLFIKVAGIKELRSQTFNVLFFLNKFEKRMLEI